ncbi:Acetoacetyl-CoA synthetase [Cladobotryum mycophilum]|uniref:Acetoacetyl-CoA synthetase n=1 Tax=Cladobotryum mycophilum TaxID=491253 RepID=A0ABR0SMT4_9HYPO
MESYDVMPRKVWEHSDPKSTAMYKFMQETNRINGLNLQTFTDMYDWAAANRASFYGQLWDQVRFIYEGSYTQVVDESIPISDLPKWFHGVRLNWAENMLYTRTKDGKTDERSTRFKEDYKTAVTEIREGNTEIRQGIREGDRVVMVGGNSYRMLTVQLATTWLGGLFSTSSTDMGVGGLLQRTVQVNPKFVFFDDGALYNGQVLDLRDKIKGMLEGMKECDQLQAFIINQRFDTPYDTSNIAKTERLETFLEGADKLPVPAFTRTDFGAPFLVFYSSGTTGIPKAIVHCVGGVLVSWARDSVLHRGAGPDDVGLQFTTTGWIMYLSNVGHLLGGGRAIFYDGSPMIPDWTVLLRIVEEQRATIMGISPRWLTEVRKAKILPRDSFNLDSLKRVTCTGMVLPDQLTEWFYDVGFPKYVQLGNMTGGTDLAGALAMENELDPLYVGGIQGKIVGVPIEVYDHDLAEGSVGKPLADGAPGDLVCTAAIPNIPVCLWNDGTGPAPGPKYHGAYFARYKGVWAQGDFCAIHPLSKAVIMLGRSDGVLNPSGVRFGSAEIYGVLERLFSVEIAESLCVGQRRPKDNDEKVVLFLFMKQGVPLDRALVAKIRKAIAKELTKRHVPRYIFEMPEVPVTVNGKKVELPVKQIISGKTIKPSGTLLNPQSLDFFYRFQKIEDHVEPQAKL